MEPKKAPREMTGAELNSMLKSSINFKSLGGMRCEELNLTEEDMQWWRDAKIGMFVHWGLYSILGRGEWVRHNEQIPWEEYTALADQFCPEAFDMHEWTDLAKEFGAKYMVMVTRHHDGFALWNSPGSYQDFTSWNTASHRDFVKEYTDCAREAGLRVGLYYSPMDWRFPGYFDPKGEEDPANADNALLMKKQCYDQVRELVSNYGKIDILWYDGGWLAHKGSDTSSSWFWEPVKLNKMAREYNPKMIMNPRSGWEGNFYCDEGSHEITGKIIPVPWEKNMCVCSGCSWGWMADDPVSDFDWLIHMLVDVVTRDGNLLLNVGPDKNGHIRPDVAERMRQIGAWLRENGDTIYKTRGGPIEPVDHVYGTTYRENEIFLHILDTEAFRNEVLPSIPYEITSCTYKGEALCFTQDEAQIQIQLPENLEKEADTIIRIRLKECVREKEQMEIHFTGKE